MPITGKSRFVERSRNRDRPNEGGFVPILHSHQGWTTIDAIRWRKLAPFLRRASGILSSMGIFQQLPAGTLGPFYRGASEIFSPSNSSGPFRALAFLIDPSASF